jgi:outer membrane protein TolC
MQTHKNPANDRVRRHALRSLIAGALLVSVLCGPAVFAVDPEPTVAVNPEPTNHELLSLVEVVRRAAVDHPDVHMQTATVAAARAAVQQRAGAFDVFLTSSVGHDHVDTAFDSQERDAYLIDSVHNERTSWRVGAEKLLDFGMTLRTVVQVERREQVGLEVSLTDDDGVAALQALPSVGRAHIAISATQALLRGRGNDTGPAAREAIAGLFAEAALHRLRHIQTSRALVAISTYWEYVAAHRRLAILGASEARAKALLAEVQLLIDMDERPAADAVHFSALVADREASRAVAQIAVVRARQALGLAMGLKDTAIRTLAPPGDVFPRPDPDWRLAPEARDRLVEQGMHARADLGAARVELEAAKRTVHVADRAQEPRLDLQLTFGYSGFDESTGAENLVTPIGGSIGGPDVGVALNFEWPIQNRTYEGRATRQRALLERARLAQEELARTIRTEIAAGAESLDLEIRAYQAVTASVALHEQTVVNQRRRLRSELSTAIDVLITEERLTGALLSALASEQRHAQALANLHFAAASLLPAEGINALGIEGLTQPPKPMAPPMGPATTVDGN